MIIQSPSQQESKISPSLPDIYRLLHQRFGCRNWWPGETCFEVVVGCILTQNTNWQNVEKAIMNLKQAGALHPERLLELPEARLVELIRPTGFFTQKPARLKRISEWWISRVGARDIPLEEQEFEGGSGRLRIGLARRALISGEPTRDEGRTLRDELLSINGVGPETADSILLYAFGFPFFVVDAYKKRILSRVGVFPENASYQQIQDLFHTAFPPEIPLYNDFHAQFIQLGKVHCRKQPKCERCPLVSNCKTGLLAD